MKISTAHQIRAATYHLFNFINYATLAGEAEGIHPERVMEEIRAEVDRKKAETGFVNPQCVDIEKILELSEIEK